LRLSCIATSVGSWWDPCGWEQVICGVRTLATYHTVPLISPRRKVRLDSRFMTTSSVCGQLHLQCSYCVWCTNCIFSYVAERDYSQPIHQRPKHLLNTASSRLQTQLHLCSWQQVSLRTSFFSNILSFLKESYLLQITTIVIMMMMLNGYWLITFTSRDA